MKRRMMLWGGELTAFNLFAIPALFGFGIVYADQVDMAPKIIHISDLHFSDSSITLDSGYLIDNQNSLFKSELFSKYLIKNKNRLGTNIIVVTGDITDSGDVGDYAIAREFLAKMRRHGFDIYCVPGNHDCSKEGTLMFGQHEDRQNATRRENFSKYIEPEELPRMVKLRGAYLILLDSMKGEMTGSSDKNCAQGALGEEQLAWLQTQLASLQERRAAGEKVAVCLHHSPFKVTGGELPADGSISAHTFGGLEDAKEFLEIVSNKIDCLLFGHTSPAGVLQQGAGSFKVQSDVYGVPMINCENLEHSPWNEEHDLPGEAKQLCMAANCDGRLEIFYIGPDSRIFHNGQVEPNGGWKSGEGFNGATNETWRGEEALGGEAKQICVGQNGDGLLEIYYARMDGEICCNRQMESHGAWRGEESLGARLLENGDEGFQRICVEQNPDGILEVFYVGEDEHVKRMRRTTPNGGWDCVEDLGGPARQVCVGRNIDGRFEVFYTGANSKIWRTFQKKAHDVWSEASLFGPHPFLQPDDAAWRMCMGRDLNGGLDLFYLGTDGELFHNRQGSANGAWRGEKRIGKFLKNIGLQLCVGSNKDGRLEVFYIGSNYVIYHNSQKEPGGEWSGEEALSGFRDRARQICVGSNPDGRLEICYIGTNNKLYHNFQTVPNGAYPITVIDMSRCSREVFYTDSPEPVEITSESK